MVTMYIIKDNQGPKQQGESCNDNDYNMINLMKKAQITNYNKDPKIITWIVYRPDRIPVA